MSENHRNKRKLASLLAVMLAPHQMASATLDLEQNFLKTTNVSKLHWAWIIVFFLHAFVFYSLLTVQLIKSKRRIKVSAANNCWPICADFSSCTCNLTPGGCDHACCCDTDCDEKTITAWRLQENYCLDELHDNAMVSIEECRERQGQPSLADLQGGMLIYEKAARNLLCT